MVRFDTDCESDLESPMSGTPGGSPRLRIAVTVPAKPAAIGAVTNGVTQVLAERQWPQDDIDAVEAAFREALANAIRHGCHGDETRYIRYSFAYEANDEVTLVVRDPGAGFDAAALPDPFDAANIVKPGGRGILMMRGLMDDVQFLDGGREVRMRKRKGSR